MRRFLLLMLAVAPAALAQSERVIEGPLMWLNDMPSLGVAMPALPMPDPSMSVVATRENAEEMQIAAQVGTLLSLRRMMVDRSGIRQLRQMPPAMRDLAIGYLRAEYALRLRFDSIVHKRGGHFSNICWDPNSQQRRIFRQTMEQCAAEMLGRLVQNFDAGYNVHAKSYPKMFGETKGRELVEFTRQHARTT